MGSAGYDWPQPSAQLLFGENIFTLSSLHVLLSAANLLCVVFFAVHLIFAAFYLLAAWYSRAQRPPGGRELPPTAACTVLTSRLLLPDWSSRARIYSARRSRHNVRLSRGGFISSWRREPVNVLELPASFESALIHFGCKPSATVPLVFSQASEGEQLYLFSCVHKEFPSTPPPPSSLQQYILRGFLWNQPSKKCGD